MMQKADIDTVWLRTAKSDVETHIIDQQPYPSSG